MIEQIALWSVVALLGTSVGASELVARYRDAPGHILITKPALLYIAINVLASVAAFALVRVFDWKFGVSGEQEIRWTQAMVAGFGSMVLFRSSLFTVRAGGQDVSIGPSTVLQAILAATDRSVDRIRARARANDVAEALVGVSFIEVHIDLPNIALALMQNLSKEEQKDLGEELATLENSTLSEHGKKMSLGLKLITLVGHDVLIAAIKALRHGFDDQMTTPASADQAADKQKDPITNKSTTTNITNISPPASQSDHDQASEGQ